MKPFDLEAAKRGESIEILFGFGTWIPCHFVGVSLDGKPVIEHQGLNRSEFTYLRMAPKPPREMWVQAYYTPQHNDKKIVCTNPKDTAEEARKIADGCVLLGDPQKIMVPEE